MVISDEDFKNMFNVVRSHITNRARKIKNLTHMVIFRKISYYADGPTYDFLDKYNYVRNNGIYWTHPESSIKMRVTNDYDRCVKGNQSNDNTCWWYFSDQCLMRMERDFNQQEVIDIAKVIDNWETIHRSPEKSVTFAIQNSRIYAAFPGIPIEQKMFSSKQLVSTFFTDDPMEHLHSHPDFSPVAKEYTNNLRKIWNGIFDQRTDLNQFKGHCNIPDDYIEKAILALDLQTDLGIEAKKILKAKCYDLFKIGCLDYLNGCVKEIPLFHQCVSNRTYISEDVEDDARRMSIGLRWILASNMTDERATIHFIRENPLLLSASWIVYMENDVISHCKDEKNGNYSPSFCSRLTQSGKSYLEASRTIINRTNEAKKAYDIIWKNCPAQYSDVYEYLAKYVMTITDWNFVFGLRSGNSRYGWIPNLD